MTLSCERLRQYCADALTRCGVREDDARNTAAVLVSADMRGIHSHGVVRMIGYVNCLKSGGVRADAVPRICRESAVSALVDADRGLGIPATLFAVEVARRKVRSTGVAVVNVFNSHHHGACGYYSQMLALEGLMAMAMSTGDVIMAAKSAKAYAITGISTDGEDETLDDITVGTTLGVALTAGAVLMQAASAGASGSAYKYQPIGLLGEGYDVKAGENLFVNIVTIGQIKEACIACGLSAAIKDDLKHIVFI